MQEGVGRMMFWHQRRWSWLQSLGGKGIGSIQVGSGHWVQSLDEGGLRRLLCVLGPSSVWVLHASLQVEFQKELGL